MAFNIRAAFIAGIAVLATAGYCSWQFSRLSQSHLNDQKSMSVTQQLGTSRAQVEQYVDKAATELTSLIEKEMSAAPLSNTGEPTNPMDAMNSIGGAKPPPLPTEAPAPSAAFTSSDFISLAVLGTAAENAPWGVEWFQTKNAQVAQSYFESQLAYLPLARVKGDQVQFARIEAPDKRIYFVLSVQIRFKSPAGEEIKIAVGLLPSTYFNSAVEAAKGSGDEIFLTDTAGFAYTYPDQQYVGAKMDVHPIVKRAIKGDVSSDVREGKNLQGQSVAGGFEKLRNSNLIMVMTSPIMARTSAVTESVLQVALVSFALVLLTAGLIAIMGRRDRLQRELLEGRLKLLETRAQTPGELKEFAGDKAKRELLRDYTSGVVQYMRGPLAAILGQSQLALSKSNDGEVKTWLTRIEKEARLSRDFVEGLAKSQGLGEVELQTVELESIVTQGLQDLRSGFSKDKINLEENYKSRARVEVGAAELRQILRHTFSFMHQRLAAISSYKKIIIDLEQAGPFLRLRISDTAPAPENDVMKKFFEPFQVDGLNFSLAKNVVEKFRGTLTAEKSETGGLLLRFDFPFIEAPAEVVAEGELRMPEILPGDMAPPTPAPKPASTKAPEVERIPSVKMANISVPEIKLPEVKIVDKPVETKGLELKIAPPVPMKPSETKVFEKKPFNETNTSFILNGQAPLEKMELKDLPPVPKRDVVIDADIKKEIFADELSVKIRKPKLDSSEEDES